MLFLECIDFFKRKVLIEVTKFMLCAQVECALDETGQFFEMTTTYIDEVLK